MSLKHFFFSLLLFFAFSLAHSQQKFTISGYVKDKSTGENLIGAAIGVVEAKTGATTNSYGYYAISLPAGKYTLRVAYIGYEQQLRVIDLTASVQLDFGLEPKEKQLKEVEITATGPRSELEKTQMGKIDLPISQVKQLPAIFGEVDILKTIQLLPGVQSGSEGTTGFFVRGGGPDQNLIILDEAPVYNASHLFGFFSVFNADGVKNVELYKGGYPARFGGRLSSVVDISLKDGNKTKFSGSGGIGLIASRLTLEGPIIKNKCSFIVSARRTYLDVFTRAYNKTKEKDPSFNPIPDYYFYDLNAKVNYELSDKNRLFLSGYFGRDVFGFKRGIFGINFDWGNSTATARWNHIFSPKLFSNTTATFTDYRYNIGNQATIFNFSIGSHIQDYSIKNDFDFALNPNHYIRFGVAETYHIFGISRVQFHSADNSINIDQENNKYASEIGAYASDDWDLSERLKVNYGLRLSGFLSEKKLYTGLEPRLSARFRINNDWSIKASYTDMNQYIHLVSSSATSLPTDVWYPSNPTVLPQRSKQVSLGVTTIALSDKVSITDEVYYKWLHRQIDFRNGADLFLNNNLDKEFVFGEGWGYGNEIFIQKQEGAFTGWIGYTLAWTWRQFDSINNGEKFQPKYDERHNISIVASYDLGKRWTFSASWVFNSGTNTTIPTGYAYFNDIPGSRAYIIPIIEKRNNYRMAPYNRLDLAAVWKFHPKWGTSDLTFSVYNAYSRRNPYILYIESVLSDSQGALRIPVQNVARQISLFPVIPSVTYNFHF